MHVEIPDLDMELAEISLVPDLEKCALLLDIDGTILDLAPSPRQVWVPPSLRNTLARLDNLTGGALALVSGRPLNEIDIIFSPLELAAVGCHGAEVRPVPRTEPQIRAPRLSSTLKRRLATIVTELGPGILVEDKGYSLALHYRLAPEKGPALEAAVTTICADAPDAVDVLPGKLVVEIKPAGINKAAAVSELMLYPPFANRNPIFIGDDTTDEPVFGIISKFGGLGFSVGPTAAVVNGHFDRPESVRAWLARIAADRKGTAE